MLNRSGVIGLVACVVAASCRSAYVEGTAGGVQGGIGHDICAVPLVIEVTVNDPSGAPVADAQVEYRVTTGGRLSWRVADGLTDSSGRLVAPGCYQAGLDYKAFPPVGDVDLSVRVTRAGGSPATVPYSVPAAAVADEGKWVPYGGSQWRGVPVIVRATVGSLIGVCGVPSNNALQLTKPAQAMELRS